MIGSVLCFFCFPLKNYDTNVENSNLYNQKFIKSQLINCMATDLCVKEVVYLVFDNLYIWNSQLSQEACELDNQKYRNFVDITNRKQRLKMQFDW